ncbi:hypothetical protein [Bdellovibrio sp. HCB337]|uniref:hypothetical protein n=1 Tax=Bdellovibrio sp. HCB337 TaxID=3394358 RepID=UPI0039A4CD2E
MKANLYILISILLVVTSCAPKLTERAFAPAKTNFSPKGEDVNLNLRLREFGEAPPELSWQESVSSAAYFDQAENMMALGENQNLPALKSKGLSWIRHFYSQPEFTRWGELATGPFIRLAASQTEKEVQITLNDVLLEMEDARPIMLSHVLALGEKMAPGIQIGLPGLLEQADKFTQLVLLDIPKMGLPTIIAEGFASELVKTTKPLFADAHVLIQDYAKVQTLSEAISVIDRAILKFQITLEPATTKSLYLGRKLARQIETMKDGQDGLSVLIAVWEMLTPQEREEKLKPANYELYAFLENQSARELECLKKRGCLGGPVDGVVKKLFVMPKIEKYGVANLKKQITDETLAYVHSEIEAMAKDFVANIPKTFADNIETAWLAKAMRMVAVRDDLQAYVTRVGEVWAKKILPQSEGRVPGFEINRVQVNASRKQALSLKADTKNEELDGEVAGSALAASSHLLENPESRSEADLRTAFSQVNKLVAFAGYRDTRNKLVPALLAPVAHQIKLLDIMDFEAAKDANFSFRLPNKMPLADAFHAAPESEYQRSFSASALSAQVRGLSRLLRWTADWRRSSFETVLGGIKAQDLTQDAESPSLQQPLFPKDMIFALNVGAVSVLLQDIQKKSSPVFMLTIEGNALSAYEYTQGTAETAVMAGVVDLENGKPTQIIQTREVARLILALAEFIQAMDGVEQTKSSVLLTKNIHGTLPLEAVISGKKELRRLIVALGNFLSTKMLTPQSLLLSADSLTGKRPTGNSLLRVETQAYGIQALVKAHEISGIDSYLWSAQEIYYAMNKTLFSVKEEFYVNSDGSRLSFPEKLTTLRALSELKSSLPPESQTQLQKVMNPWVHALLAIK